MRNFLTKLAAGFLLGSALFFGGAQVTHAAGADTMLENLTCGIGGTDSLEGCLPLGVYYLVYLPLSNLLILSGYLFDVAISLSIDTHFVNQQFVTDTWTVVRDFSNMLFIFILLYTGVQTVLGLGNWRKTILNVVIIALLINFSLFFTKVVIDAGNILAVGIYESMGVVKDSSNGAVLKATGSNPAPQERNLSEVLVANFQPQKFLAKAGEVGSPWNSLVVFIVAAIVNAVAAYVMFKVALLFVGRMLAFWFLMISSPFAFISIALPKGGFFNTWSNLLFSQTFMAPVFLFLLYLLMKILSYNGGILQGFLG